MTTIDQLVRYFRNLQASGELRTICPMATREGRLADGAALFAAALALVGVDDDCTGPEACLLNGCRKLESGQASFAELDEALDFVFDQLMQQEEPHRWN